MENLVETLITMSKVTTNDLMKIVECPLCKGFPVLPIWLCAKGHHLCNNCRLRLPQSKCTLCGVGFTQFRNLTIETMALTLASDFPCENQLYGCSTAVPTHHRDDHRDRCDFRPITCHLVELNECKTGMEMGISDYFDHLVAAHNVAGGKDTDASTLVLRQSGREGQHLARNYWGCKFMKYDGHIFITSSFRVDSTVHWNLALIGGEVDAKHYVVKITIANAKIFNGMPKFEKTIPVVSVRRYRSIIETQSNMPYVKLTENELKQLSSSKIISTLDPSPTNGNGSTSQLQLSKLQWLVQFRVLKR